METLSLREMIWLAHSSAWALPSLGRRLGANLWIVHAEHCAAVPNTAQWRERSAWSEEPIGAILGLIRRLGLLGPGIFQPVHAERPSVRIIVPHGSGLESLRALAKDGMVVGVDGLRVGLVQHVQEGLARRRQGLIGW